MFSLVGKGVCAIEIGFAEQEQERAVKTTVHFIILRKVRKILKCAAISHPASGDSGPVPVPPAVSRPGRQSGFSSAATIVHIHEGLRLDD